MELKEWYERNHESHPGFWLKVSKKGSGLQSVSAAEALDEALCYGWIDGLVHPGDSLFYLKKFTKRGARSIWSKINQTHIQRLSEEGRMQQAGFAAVEAAKADGRWDLAYSSPKNAEIPKDFLEAVERDSSAASTFSTLNRSHKYTIYFQLSTAKKEETRLRRFEKLLEKLKNGETNF